LAAAQRIWQAGWGINRFHVKSEARAVMIYLDNNSTTQPLPEVVEAMAEMLRKQWANPSSIHQFGQGVRHRMEEARAQVARPIGATAKEIIFTSGGTESINLAIRGGLALRAERRRFVTTAVEHSATIHLAEQLAREGYAVDYVGVDSEGRIDEAEWDAKVREDVGLVSFMHVNNETGVIWDVSRLAKVASERGVLVHVDAVQSIGKMPVNVADWPVQFVSMAAHKFHGPKGVGALYVKRRTRLQPMLFGGTQERELRPGTENVAGMVGMAVAAEAALRDMPGEGPRIAALRDRLEQGILAAAPFARVNAANAPRIHNTTNISFDGLEAEAILILLSEAGICASAGSACSSGSLEPSHVLKAMGLDERRAHGAIRLSLSRFNTQAEVDEVIAILPGLLSRLTKLDRASRVRERR
jgi:cysteine desulfurase